MSSRHSSPRTGRPAPSAAERRRRRPSGAPTAAAYDRAMPRYARSEREALADLLLDARPGRADDQRGVDDP